MKIKILFSYVIIFFVALAVSRGFLSVNFSSKYTETSIYENFYTHIIEKSSSSKQCGDSGDLSDRHKLRAGFQKIKIYIYDLAKDFFDYRGVGVSFYIIHALAVLLMFHFTHKISLHLVQLDGVRSSHEMTSPKNYSIAGVLILDCLIFLTFYAYVFNGQVGEYTFSIFEGLFVSIALYGILKEKIIIFLLATTFAVLNRESGFILLILWIIFNGLNLGSIQRYMILLIPVIIFSIVNNEILHCILKEGFLISSKTIPGQLTYHVFFDGVWGLIRGTLAIILNYGLILIPTFVLHKRYNKYLGKDSKTLINGMLISIVVYVVVFIFATPLNHMSVKFIILPLVLPLLSVYILQIIQNEQSGIK